MQLFAVWIVKPEVVPEIQRAGKVPPDASCLASVMLVCAAMPASVGTASLVTLTKRRSSFAVGASPK